MSTIIYKYSIYIYIYTLMFSLNSRKEKKQKQDCTTLPKGNKIMPQLTNETMKVRDENTHTKKSKD